MSIENCNFTPPVFGLLWIFAAVYGMIIIGKFRHFTKVLLDLIVGCVCILVLLAVLFLEWQCSPAGLSVPAIWAYSGLAPVRARPWRANIKKQPILLDCHVVTPAKLFLFQKICKYCLNAFVNFFLQKTLQIDNWLFENYCSQVSIKIRKSPNHKGLNFICAFTFSVFGIESLLSNIEYLFALSSLTCNKAVTYLLDLSAHQVTFSH